MRLLYINPNNNQKNIVVQYYLTCLIYVCTKVNIEPRKYSTSCLLEMDKKIRNFVKARVGEIMGATIRK
jgi:hypothetical protein